tara:strand:- start:1413 stop:2192 length:780 start_codon:yes stop_codon:yes gene_type:complete
MPPRPGEEAYYTKIETYYPRTGNYLSDTKDILLKFFQKFFYEMPTDQNLFHFEPGSESLDYSTAETETELIITDGGSINTDTLEKRPAIIISRGPFAYANTSMDQLLSVKASNAKRTHTDLVTGSFVINCISSVGLEAERLASMVARALRIYRRDLQEAGFHLVGNMIRIGQESSPGQILSGDSDEDFVNVPVTFPVYYQDSWTVTPEAQLLNNIKITLQAVFYKHDGSLLYPDAVDSDGNVNESSEGVIVESWKDSSS